MSDNSAIEWTGTTWNPTTGCDKVSPGCGLPRPGTDDEATGRTGGCYAMAMAKRLNGMGSAKYQNDGDPRTSGPGFGLTMHESALDAPLHWRDPRTVFVNSMSDLFHASVSDVFIARVFAVMAVTPQHTYQVLSKRHARMRVLLTDPDFRRLVGITIVRDNGAHPAWRYDDARYAVPAAWPLPNVWLGVSVEDQHWADTRPGMQGRVPDALWLKEFPRAS